VTVKVGFFNKIRQRFTPTTS